MNFPRDLSFSFLGSEVRFMIVKQKMAGLEAFTGHGHTNTNCILQYKIHPINNLHCEQRRQRGQQVAAIGYLFLLHFVAN